MATHISQKGNFIYHGRIKGADGTPIYKMSYQDNKIEIGFVTDTAFFIATDGDQIEMIRGEMEELTDFTNFLLDSKL